MEYGLVATWWVAYVGLALFGLPIAAWLCSTLPGRGAGLSLGVALTVVTLVAFWVGHLALGWVALGAGLVALAVAAVLAVRAGVAIDRRAAAEALSVFTLVYLGVVVVRSVEPGITPLGEKFLDFGLLATLYRAPRLPPEDFWFAGKSLIYYYGGHFLASLLTRLTGTHPWFGFNLSMAGFFGTLAAGAYELAGSIAASGADDSTRRTPADSGPTAGLRSTADRAAAGLSARRERVIAGVTAVFFTIWASNPSTAVRLLVRRLPATIRDGAAMALAAAHSQLVTEWILEPVPEAYNYKVAGRILPELYTPFPLFGIVRGDIRPYLLSTPFLVVATGVCYAYYRTPEAAIARRRGLVFGAVPVVGGFMAIVNTWSFPVVLGVLWLSLSFADAELRSLLPARAVATVDRFVGVRSVASHRTARGALARTIGAAGITVLAGIVGTLVALPFLLGPVSSRPSTPIVVLEAAARSPLGSSLLVHGGFLAVIVAAWFAGLRDRSTTPVAIAALLAYVVLVSATPATLVPFALFGPLLAVGWYLLATDREGGFAGVLVVAGLGLVLLAELVYVREGGGSRFNTVVKTYMPTWILWASATGVLLPRLVRGRGEWSWRRRRQQVGAALAALLVVSTGAFGAVALASHFVGDDADGPTLDGMAAAEEEIPGQVAAIRWLDDRSGRPTVLAAPGLAVYAWSASPAASLTGLPTVVGVSHEIQYRNRTAYIERARAVNTLYLAPDGWRADLLAAYDVEYVYVGPAERARYGDVRSFADLRGVTVAFRADDVTIYAVNRSRLPTGSDDGDPPTSDSRPQSPIDP
jgi:YYY domain-containing protein